MTDDGAEPTPAQTAAQPGTPAGSRGRLVVAERVVVSVARLATREVGGTVVTGGGPLERGLPRVRAEVAGSRTRMSVHVAAQWPYRLDELARTLRSVVADRVRHLTGLTVDGVDVVIETVLLPQDVEPARSLL